MFNKNTVKGLEGDVHYRSGTSDHNDTRIFEEEFYTNNNGVLSNSEFLKLLWIIFSSDSLTFINEHQLCLILELKVGILKWNPWWVKPTSVNDWLELHVGPTSADWMSVPVNTNPLGVSWSVFLWLSSCKSGTRRSAGHKEFGEVVKMMRNDLFSTLYWTGINLEITKLLKYMLKLVYTGGFQVLVSSFILTWICPIF